MTETLIDFDPAGDLAASLVALLPQDQLNVDPDQLRQLLATAAAPLTQRLKPLALRAQAIELQQQAGDLLDEADRAEQHADLAKAADEAEQAHAAAVAEAERLAAVVQQLVAAERQAVDRLAGAAEHARLMQERVEELALADAVPAVQTKAIVERDAANLVAAQFRVKVEQVAADRVTSEASLATARDVVRQRRAVAKAAQDQMANPPAALVSAITATLDGVRRLSLRMPLDRGAQASVADLVEALMSQLGLDRIYVNRGRAAEQEDQRQRASGRLLPKAGAERRPGTVVPPPGTAPLAPLLAPTR